MTEQLRELRDYLLTDLARRDPNRARKLCGTQAAEPGRAYCGFTDDHTVHEGHGPTCHPSPPTVASEYFIRCPLEDQQAAPPTCPGEPASLA